MPDSFQYVEIDRIKIGKKTERKVDIKKVESIIQAIEAGNKIRPIKLSRIENGYVIIGDGRHRFLAYKKLGIVLIPAIIQRNKLSTTRNKKGGEKG